MSILEGLQNNALERTRRVGVPATRAIVRVSPCRSTQCSTGLVSSPRVATSQMRLLSLCLFLFAATLAPRAAEACVCVRLESDPPWPSLEESVKRLPVALVGRVVRQGSAPQSGGVAYLDVEVLRPIKGIRASTTVRVWDVMAGSSCSAGLERFGSGSLLAFVLERSKAQRELIDLLRLPVRSGDYVVGAEACAESFRQMGSEAEAISWAKARGSGR